MASSPCAGRDRGHRVPYDRRSSIVVGVGCRRRCCGCRRSWPGWNALLDDAAFFAPFAPHFHPVLGRPSTPVEWYLRLMFLKFRYRLGYESLCAEVSDSISWRPVLPDRPGRAGAARDDADEADHPVRRGGGGRAERGAAGQGGRAEVLRTGRLGADTTVIAADVAYPTDSGLLARAAGKMARTVRRAGGRGRHPDPGAGPAAGCRAAGAGDRGQAADPGLWGARSLLGL